MGINEIIILICISISIFLWATELVNKAYVSIALIVAFLLLTDVQMDRIFAFPLSSNFLTIVSSFLIAQGVVKSGIAKVIADKVLHRYCSSLLSLMISGAILNMVLAFAIPQPVPRITLLGTVYNSLLTEQNLRNQQKKAVLFSIFVTATTTALLIMNGDIILNNAALAMGMVSLNQMEWIKYMTVPTVLATCSLIAMYYFTHRKSFEGRIDVRKTHFSISREGKITRTIVVAIILLWMTESLHGISQSLVSIAGVAVMFLLNILKKEDIKQVNISLLVFLTAEFALGNVLVDTGIAERISQVIMNFIPVDLPLIALVLILIFMVIIIHTVFGGAMSSMSVTIPIALTIWGQSVNNIVISLIVLILVTCQYVFPYNQLTILVGYGQGYYEFRDVMKFSIPLTLWAVATVLLIYMPWWSATGLM